MKTSRVSHDFPVVHAVTDSTAVMQANFMARATAVMRALGPRGALHLRCSRASGRRLYDLSLALAPVQHESGCWLIVNDRIDIALGAGARGAQLASHSMAMEEALRVTRSLPIGVSIHSVEEAVEAQAAGAAWCVAGTVFATPSHPGRPPARLDFVRDVAGAVEIPVIAIGGITPEDVGPLLRAGAHGVAIIRGAGWSSGFEGSAPRELPSLPGDPRVSVDEFGEPVRRYISAYDSESRRDARNHADGERRHPGAGPE